MIVFIPTAGLGTRLKEKTSNLNKSLLDINNKPVISHIIEKFPSNTKFVVAVGYKGDLVKQYLKLVYSNKIIKFVDVYPYKGKNSGLGLTLIKSSKFLKTKFLFISCDTLIKKKINYKNYNWIGYSNKKAGKEYRSLDINKNKLIKINEKKIKNKNKKTYIGLAFIKNFKEFWKFTKSNYKYSKNQGEVYGINKLSKKYTFFTKKIDWDDVGTYLKYEKAKLKYKKKNEPIILPKENESIWFANNLVIKYSSDINFIKKRVVRAKILKNYVPKVIKFSKNIYIYKYVPGKILSKVLTLDKFKIFLNKLKKFWKINNKINKKKFQLNCLKFYKNKTIDRINLFNKKYNFKDEIHTINNSKIDKFKFLLKRINWKNISNGTSSRFHGDLHFENIIYSKKKFKFLDWRQDFENDLKNGDLYYDLAKLLHGLIVDHNQVNKNNFKINIKKKNIELTIKKTKNHKLCHAYFENWIVSNGFDLQKVRIITALIYLNISPLHHYPYSMFLYFLGKKMLSDELKKI